MDTQKTALYEYHKSLGAKFVPFAGYQMPVQYSSGIVEEHKTTRSEAGLFDVSHMGQLSIEGSADLILALEKIIPTDFKNIKLNQSKYSFLTNENGGIYDDLIVTKVERGFNIILNAACKDNDFKIIKNALGGKFKLTLHKDLSLIALQGPRASEVLEKIVNKVLEHGMPNDTLLNVNIPKDVEGGIKGYQITHQGAIYFEDNFEKREDPRGRIYYWMTGDVKDTDIELESDGVAIKEGYVSITPLQLQMTNFDFIEKLNEWSF